MRPIYLLLVSIVCFSCGNERILQLPEIQNADVTEIRDVSHAYLFYDETKEDSIELNRKNLIITTNWLINVDKRLTLGQVIPKIKFLQEKKRNAELHKNEDAKNYFTCNDTSIKNLGFLEFTDIYYEKVELDNDSIDLAMLETSGESFKLSFEHVYIALSVIIDKNGLIRYEDEYVTILQYINKIPPREFPIVVLGSSLNLFFDKNMSFQNYINFKSSIKNLKIEDIIIDNREFIY
ncbi:hypothetical protein [Psychroserpens sp.]|jgi:hypothetical protein|uniref:hypothetical protein n=1 Tax=Psychroserpens sp. TaxID=2020870 RepID=UPI0039E551D3